MIAWPLAAAGPTWGRDDGFVPVPALTGHVVDLAGVLPESEARALDARLMAFEESKGSQVAVLIVPTTRPEEIEQYSIRVAEAWKLGRKKVDDGAILLVATQDRALRIEVGYGLEGALTDLRSKRIIDEIITPAFRRGDFAGGVTAGADAMMKVIGGEELPPPTRRVARPGGNRGLGFEGLVGLGVIAFGVSRVLGSALGRTRGGMVSGLGLGGMGWLLGGSLGWAFLGLIAGFIFALMGAAGFGNGFSSGGRRSGWGGGGSGWGGGGGGGFGGGGASGRW